MKALEKPEWKRREERRTPQLIWLALALLTISVLSVSAYFFIENSALSNVLISADQKNSRSINVRSGGDFQKAINEAKPGDTILLEPGAHFVGNFRLPFKEGGDYVTIRSAAPDKDLPAEFTRINPEQYRQFLPKLSSSTLNPVMMTDDRAHHYRFIGIEFGGTKDGNGNIIQIGTGEERTLEEIPHHIEFDRVFIHAESPLGQRRGIAANGRYIKIANSYISGMRRKGDESQAIAVWASDGPVEITNNYLEGAGENILFGGGSSYLKLVPTDCLVRDNHLNKPLEWRNDDWLVKNLFEIKNGKRIKVENNLMTNNWAMGQEGTAVLFTVREDNGKATLIEDVMFINNIVRSSGNAINILGSEGSGGHRLSIINNIFDDIDNEKWGGRGFFLLATDWNGVNIENNTIVQKGSITIGYGKPIKGFVFRENIVFHNDYGFHGDNTTVGVPSLEKYFPNYIVTGNVIIGSEPKFGISNFYPANVNQVGFEDFKSGKYLLKENSPYDNKGAGSKPLGAKLDISAVGRSN
ncbi:MAG: hypothetical protein KIS76_11615 [Pyrinomonadaceae bacterium]|nr:hypothetical protein [Pyrinomonadaceae bacterium]